MRIQKVHIKNYRCLQDIQFDLGEITCLIGMNGVGKSAALRALAAFYDLGDLPTSDDWFEGRSDQELEVALTFSEVSNSERELFSRYVTAAGTFRVSRVWELEDGRIRDHFYGYHLACPDFQGVRDAERQVTRVHNDLVDTGRYEGLQKVARQDDVESALQAWESANSDQCQWIRDGGKFFGWKQVGGARLGSATNCVYVPAVRDARDDAAQTKGSALSQIVELVLKSELQSNPDLAGLRSEIEGKFGNILTETRPALETLANQLSSVMEQYVPGSGVVLDWRSGTPALPDWPPIEARLVEEGFESPVWAKGHGLQRSFIMSVLQRLAEARSETSEDGSSGSPHTILLIEEPELYQHPIASRQFAKVLRRLASGERPIQIAYSTHDPEFVAFDYFDSIRRLDKTKIGSAGAPSTKVNSLNLDEVSNKLKEIWDLDPESVTSESTRQRLRTVLTSQVSEGFFARAIILVEGGQDKAMIEALAAKTSLDLEAKGLSIIPVGGKGNLDRPLIVFSGFGIPCYVIWDGDKENTRDRDVNARTNKVLLKLVGLEEEEFPQTSVGQGGAVFENRLESELAAALGDRYEELVQRAAIDVRLVRGRDVLKTRYGCESFVDLLNEEGLDIPSLDEIVNRIRELSSA